MGATIYEGYFKRRSEIIRSVREVLFSRVPNVGGGIMGTPYLITALQVMFHYNI